MRIDQPSKKPFVYLNRNAYQVVTDHNTKKYEKDMAYVFDNEIFIYKGVYKKDKKMKEGCFYLNSETKKPIFKRSEFYSIKKEDIFYKSEDMESRIRNIIVTTSESSDEILKINKEIKEKNKKKRDRNVDCLNYSINEDDSKIVKMIKEIVNSSNLSMEDIYDKIKDKSKAYNLIYGLRTRKSLKMDIVERWAEILDMEVEVNFVNKDH